jgi:NAD(P) transhydrogenase subunit alpha
MLDTTTVNLAVPTETRPGERRVALVPDVVKKLAGAGWNVVVQSGAGAEAAFPDEAYRQAGATIAPDAAATHDGAALVVSVNAPDAAGAHLIPRGAVDLSFFSPGQSAEAVRVLAERGVTVFSFDLLPRISRAQGMDALSSQSTVSGYRAGLTAAEHLAKFFPMFMTAAGTVPPAKVLVMGVGVAGLQAIATARRLGAVVKAYDVRAAAKEEAESLGATFLDLGVSADGAGGYARELSEDELVRQRAALASEVAASDVVITTAAVPGRAAPILVSQEMVEGMAQGAVVVDMAADSGGGARGRAHRRHGQPAVRHADACQLPLRPQCRQRPGTHGQRRRLRPGLGRRDRGRHVRAARRRGGCTGGRRGARRGRRTMIAQIGGTGIVEYLTVFALAAFVGIEVVSKVPSILHTPLMSGSNAIHGIVLVGALTIMGEAAGTAQLILGFLAVFLATLNVVGGFVVTDRMLEMFRAKPNERAAAPRSEAKDEPGEPG